MLRDPDEPAGGPAVQSPAHGYVRPARERVRGHSHGLFSADSGWEKLHTELAGITDDGLLQGMYFGPLEPREPLMNADWRGRGWQCIRAWVW